MRILVLIAICLLVNTISSSAEVKWSQGSIVLATGEVRQGEIAFQVSEIVLFRTKNELTVYPAHKIHSFYYFDKPENINRKFIALSSGNGKPSAFYEVVVWGEVKVIRKLKSSVLSNRKKSDNDDYFYFTYQQNSIVDLKDFRRKVYPNLISGNNHILNQINEQHLNPNDDSDAIKIIRLYNKLAYTETLIAGISF